MYQVEKYLDECVESILRQSYGDFELILVDDGSTDRSPAICDDWAQRDQRVQAIHQPNGGSAAARNAGLDVAKGLYVVFLDSDDFIIDSDFLLKLLPGTQSELDLLLYGFRKYFESTGHLAPCTFRLPEAGSRSREIGEVLHELVQNDAFYAAAWTKAVRTAVLKENRIRFQEGMLGEDQEWYYHVILAARSIGTLDEDLVAYRQRLGSVTSTASARHLADSLRILTAWSRNLSDLGENDSRRTPLLASLAKLYCNMLILYAGLDSVTRRDYRGDVQALAHLLDYTLNPRTRTVSRFYRLVGFDGTVMALRVALVAKRR